MITEKKGSLKHQAVNILREHGLNVTEDSLKQIDRWVTCSTIENPGDNKGSFYLQMSTGVLTFVHWKRFGSMQRIFLKDVTNMTAFAQRKAQKQVLKLEQECQEMARALHEFTATHVKSEYGTLEMPTTANSYLAKKAMPVLPCMRCNGDRLILPIVTLDNDLVNLEEITPDGKKNTYPGGRVKGCVYPMFKKEAPASETDESSTADVIADTLSDIDVPRDTDAGTADVDVCNDEALTTPNGQRILCITEGFATGYAVHKATGCDTLAVRSANNIMPVVKALTQHPAYKHYAIVICADNDKHENESPNTGVVTAKKVANRLGTYLAISPAIQGKKSDFDDVFRSPEYGPECVWETIEKAVKEGAFPIVPEGFVYEHDTGSLYREAFEDKIQVVKPVCTGLYIRGRVRDTKSTDWGSIIEIRDACGKLHSMYISSIEPVASSQKFFETVCTHGLRLASADNSIKQALCNFVTAYDPQRYLLLAKNPGWMGNVYVGMSRVIGYDGIGDEPYLLSSATTASPVAGTWEGSQRLLSLLTGSPVAEFCVCHFLAGYLLSLLHMEGSGILIIGNSSSGKSTILKAIASLKGNPQQVIYSGRSTDNACEALFAQSNDSCLLIDEIGQMNPRSLPHVAYMMGNGIAKARMTKSQRLKDPARWCCTTIMTGEKSLEDILREASERPMAGQQVRLVSIDVTEDKERGIFSHIPSSMANTTELVNEANRLSNENHGHVEAMFINFLVSKRRTDPTFLETCRQRVEQYTKALQPAASGNQLKRIISHFAVDVLAGDLAKEAGILPNEFQPMGSLLHCLDKLIEQRGSAEDLENSQIVESILALFAMYGRNRFDYLPRFEEEENNRPVPNRIGFFTYGAGVTEYYIPATTLKELIAPKGYSMHKVNRALASAKMIETYHVNKNGKGVLEYTKPKILPGLGNVRTYTFRLGEESTVCPNDCSGDLVPDDFSDDDQTTCCSWL